MLPLRPSSRSTPACWEPWMYSRAPRLFDPGVDPPGPWQPHGRSPLSQMPSGWPRLPGPGMLLNRGMQSTRGVRYVPAQLRAAWLHRSLTGDRPCLILDTSRGFSAPRCDGTLDREVCLAGVGMTGIGARCTCLAVPCLPVLACRLEGLQPDVLFGDGAVAPFRYGHHPAVAFHLPDHARPFSGPEPDRV
jgi:hypothetical protein